MFEKRDNKLKSGKYLGYTLALFIFSVVLYFVLSFFEKIPNSWNYLHVLFLSIFIILIGKRIKFWLEK